MSDDAYARFRDLGRRTGRTVFWHPYGSPAATFADLAREAEERGLDWDRYGERGAVAALEEEVAGLLGTPSAVLFPSGVMAQQSVLRTWCDRSGSRRVALPDLSHLIGHEADGPRRLHGFELEHLTTGRQVATAESLAAVPGRLGAVLVELPLRDAGCLLPTWDELTALSAAARERGVPLHADGARLWEAQAHWGRPLPEVVALLDSVYVSLYKGLAGPSGALVACSEDVGAEVRTWRTRMGGTLFSLTTQAVGGLVGLSRELPRMAEYHAWAQALAAALLGVGLRVHPDPPHAQTFEVYAAGEVEAVNARALAVGEREGLLVTGPWRAADVPGWVVCELACYGAALDHDPGRVARWLGEVADL